MRYLFVFVLVMGWASTGSAQRIEVRGYGEADLDALLRSTLDNAHQLIVRDMTISRGDTVRGDLVVVRARLVLEGTVIGNIVGVDANMYFRPSAVVTGRVTNVAGGFYPSEQARIGHVDDRPLAPYNVRDDNGILVIEGTNRRPAIKLGGMFGVMNPEYNRVDGLRAEFGPTLLLPPFAGVEPFLSGSVGYALERNDMILRAGIGAKRGRSTLQFGWEDHVTETNDRWIRSDLKNSLSFIWNGKDYRNYYEAQRWFGEFNRTIERGARTSRYWVRGQREDASPLVARDPWVILKPDSVRVNPLIPVSTVTSLIVGAESEWAGLASQWVANAWVETAGSGLVDSDHAFNMYAVDAVYAMKAIANHSLEVEGNFRGPLPGTDELPEQRWTHVGGSGTLYTFDIGEFRGDRLAFLKTEYTIPFSERLALPFLGLPKLKLMHNIGMAWSRDVDHDFEQNIGARIQFSVAHVRYVMNPRNSDAKWSVGVSLPSKTYPWEKAQKSPVPLPH
jgi:hypothetical protein